MRKLMPASTRLATAKAQQCAHPIQIPLGLNPKQQRRFARQQGQEHGRASNGEEQATADQSAFFPIHFLQGNPHVQIHH